MAPATLTGIALERLKEEICKKSFSERLLAAANSAIFLWLLSAIALSIGGTYYVQRKECLAEADRLVSKLSNGINELSSKELYVEDAAKRARNIQEFKEMIKTASYVQADFRNYSRDSILHALWTIMHDAGLIQSDPSFPEGADLPGRPNPSPEEIEAESKRKSFEELYRRFGYGAGDVFAGHVAPDVSDGDLPMIRAYVREVTNKPVWSGWGVEPNCSFQSEMKRLLLGTPLKAVRVLTARGRSD
jgi:hypothetical protein